FFRARTYTGYPIGILLFQAFCDMTDPRDSIPATAAKIEISLSRLPQLFNSLDPSPFLERDLDRDAEDYIVGSAEEAPRQHPLALVIHLPADQLPAQGLPNVREAIPNYFAYRRDQERRRLRLLFRDGRIALLIGLTFLFCCMLLRELANSFGNDTASDIFGEGMLIIGWVAMWRPLEIFLYEWVPIRRRCRILAKLAEMPVIVRREHIGCSSLFLGACATRAGWNRAASALFWYKAGMPPRRRECPLSEPVRADLSPPPARRGAIEVSTQFAIRTPSGRFGFAERVEFGSLVRLLAQDGDRPPSLRLDSGGDLDWRPGPLPDADPRHPREPDLAAGARDRQLTKTRRERRAAPTPRPQRRDHNTDRVVRLESDKRRCLPHDLREPPLDRLTCPA